MENNTVVINGQEIDVTTVMDITATYTPTEEMCEKIKGDVTELLEKYLDVNIRSGYGLKLMLNPGGAFWRAKGWLIKAFANHPAYNGNLQLVMTGDMSRGINCDGIRNFEAYIWDWSRDNREMLGALYLDGKPISKEEYILLSNARNAAERMAFNHEVNGNYKWYEKYAELYCKINDKIFETMTMYQMLRKAMRYIDDYLLDGEVENPQLSNEELASKINNLFGERFCSSGQKVSRIVGKIGKLVGLNKHTDVRNVSFFDANGVFHERVKDMGWNYQFARFADSINPLPLKGTVVISVNPYDFYTMSFLSNAASCMTIDKNNLRGCDCTYEGMYCGGTESYMLDPCTVVLYYLPDGWKGEHPEYEDKLKRCLFYIGEDKIVQSRLYPDGRDGGDAGVAPKAREIMQKVVSELFDIPNLWKLEKGTSACSEVTITEGIQYPDYRYYDDCNVSYNRRIDGYLNKKKILIGVLPICPECGETHSNSGNVFCRRHANNYDYVCEDCGIGLNEDDVCWVGDTAYCSDCVSTCEHCDEYVHEELTEVAYINWHGRRCHRYVCQDCLDYHYVWSDYDEEYILEENAIETEEGDYFFPESEGYGICERCEGEHNIEELFEHNGSLYCASCLEEVQEEEAEEGAEEEDA